MQLTLMRTAKDIIYFIIVLVFFIVCAALGLQLLYYNYRDEKRIENDDFGKITCTHQGDSFSSKFKTTKTLFWHLYGYGDPDDANLVVGNNYYSFPEEQLTILCNPATPEEKKLAILNGTVMKDGTKVNITKLLNPDDQPQHQPTEFMGYIIVFLYDMTAIVILLNILVAMMNNTFTEVMGNANSEWKFSIGNCPLAFGV